MKKSIFYLSLTLVSCFAFGQCGPYTLTVTGSNCPFVITVSGASAAQQIVWDINGIPFDTVLWTVSGITIAGGNGAGIAANQLAGPTSVYGDLAGNIYVADPAYGLERIQKFPPGSTSATNGTTIAGGNWIGEAANQFYNPRGVCLDMAGNVYVADAFNTRIQKFPPGSTSATNGTTVAGGYGYQGNGPCQLEFPVGVCVDTAGNIYVADNNNNRIQMFPPNSTCGTTVAGGNGIYAYRLYNPRGVYVDMAGNIYVADMYDYRIQKFPAGSTSATNGITVAGGNGQGSAANQLNEPSSVYVDGSGDIYVADMLNKRIQKFPAGSTSATNGITVAGGNGQGSAANQFDNPSGVYVDTAGNIYVADANNNRVQKWSSAITTKCLDTSIFIYYPGIYSAIVIDTSGCIDSSNTVTVICTGGIANENADVIKIYPNPASSQVIIDMSMTQTKNAEIIMTDISGKQLFTKEIVGSDAVPLSEFPEGIYMLQVRYAEQVKNIKLVVIH